MSKAILGNNEIVIFDKKRNNFAAALVSFFNPLDRKQVFFPRQPGRALPSYTYIYICICIYIYIYIYIYPVKYLCQLLLQYDSLIDDTILLISTLTILIYFLYMWNLFLLMKYSPKIKAFCSILYYVKKKKKKCFMLIF